MTTNEAELKRREVRGLLKRISVDRGKKGTIGRFVYETLRKYLLVTDPTLKKIRGNVIATEYVKWDLVWKGMQKLDGIQEYDLSQKG